MVARRSGLGRGLGALIPPEAGGAEQTSYREVPTSAIEANPNQPRRHFDEDTLSNLTASVRELGVLQPLLVRPLGDDRYELIAGERRWRAARRAGLTVVPVLVRPVVDSESLEQALVENLHRQDLNALEEAAAYQQLIEEFGLTHERVATRVGRSRTAVTNALRLFQLPPSVQRLVRENRLSAGHARALLANPDRASQEELASRAVAEGWSVRAIEEAVRASQPTEVEIETEAEAAATPAKPATPTSSFDPAAPLRPAGLVELERMLADRLDTRVRVEEGSAKGRVVVEFADLADLERIARVMLGTTQH